MCYFRRNKRKHEDVQDEDTTYFEYESEDEIDESDPSYAYSSDSDLDDDEENVDENDLANNILSFDPSG